MVNLFNNIDITSKSLVFFNIIYILSISVSISVGVSTSISSAGVVTSLDVSISVGVSTSISSEGVVTSLDVSISVGVVVSIDVLALLGFTSFISQSVLIDTESSNISSKESFLTEVSIGAVEFKA